MTPLRDHAFVLRLYPFAESDAVVVLLTSASGKARLVCKGIKRVKNSFHGVVQPYHFIDIRFRMGKVDQLGQLYEASLIHPFRFQDAHLESFYLFAHLSEILIQLEMDSPTGHRLYRLLDAMREALGQKGYDPVLLAYCYYWILQLEGVMPDHEQCAVCRKRLSPNDPDLEYLPEGMLFHCKNCRSTDSDSSLRTEASEILTLVNNFRRLHPAGLSITLSKGNVASSVLTGYNSKISEITEKNIQVPAILLQHYQK